MTSGLSERDIVAGIWQLNISRPILYPYIGSSPQKTGVVVELRSKNSKSFALLLELLFRGYNDSLRREEARQTNLGRLQQLRR